MHRRHPPANGRLVTLCLGLALALTGLALPATVAAQSPTPVPPCGETQLPQCLPPTAAPSGTPTDLEGTPWVVTQVVVVGVLTIMPLDGPVANLTLHDSRAVGNGGCNAFTTRYVLEGAAITFERVDSTRRQCLVAAPAEDPLFEALPLVAAWSMTDGTLTFADTEGGPLVVLQTGVGPGTGIRGVWRITGLAARDGTAVDAALLGEAAASFGGGQFRATVGCNWIQGSYTEDGPNIEFGDRMRTRMYCDDLMEAEDVLDAAIGEITSSAIEDDTLVLTDDDGNGRIWLVPARGQTPQPTPSAGPGTASAAPSTAP